MNHKPSVVVPSSNFEDVILSDNPFDWWPFAMGIKVKDFLKKFLLMLTMLTTSRLFRLQTKENRSIETPTLKSPSKEQATEVSCSSHDNRCFDDLVEIQMTRASSITTA